MYRLVSCTVIVAHLGLSVEQTVNFIQDFFPESVKQVVCLVVCSLGLLVPEFLDFVLLLRLLSVLGHVLNLWLVLILFDILLLDLGFRVFSLGIFRYLRLRF